MPHIRPPTALPSLPIRSIFLAGSIEMGQCQDWQSDMAAAVQAVDPSILVLNPRRSDWDASWAQTPTNPDFRAQVEWELAAIEAASVVVFYFDPQTRAPVSLLELGLLASSRPSRVMVCCPPGYWRRGNVQIVCERYGIRMVETLDALTKLSLERVNAVC